jgi:hypothetical protein
LTGRTVPNGGWHLAAGFLVIIIIAAFIVAVVVTVIVAVADSSDLVGFLIKCPRGDVAAGILYAVDLVLGASLQLLLHSR